MWIRSDVSASGNLSPKESSEMAWLGRRWGLAVLQSGDMARLGREGGMPSCSQGIWPALVDRRGMAVWVDKGRIAVLQSGDMAWQGR
ncbi:hypothetical protein DPMN_156219 [Dreissena polymorpha]|uniref:Uncharacterized protein n=1 Tax=Dreissena polymorpha TaxID=45954 RepID=A0A9D4FT63_DREPO|nr:hypothetical protein DPMN_156219 [Dreissena polymorpha]